jgi:hypothetical protein
MSKYQYTPGPRMGEPEFPNTPTQIQPFRMPTIEEVRAQEVWNNCAVRSVASGVMGEDWLINLPSLLVFNSLQLIFFF